MTEYRDCILANDLIERTGLPVEVD